jgi:serine/threonine protein kinase
LDEKYNIKLCDFGWATEENSERKSYCGTLDFMAPEIMNG